MVMLCLWATSAHAVLPAGLDARVNIGPYMDAQLPTDIIDPMPLLLSDTGAFADTPNMTPHAGLIPFDVNSPLWSDRSLKARWIGLPYDGTPGGSPVINFSTSGIWTFPVGTVLVKHFALVVDERIAALDPIRRLETRILILNADGTIRGATYRWRPDNLEADLVTSATNEVITITQPDNSTRNQTWLYPGPNDCTRCHNNGAGMVLGVKTGQLNGNHTYVQPDLSPDRVDNQLHTWYHLGMFDASVVDSPSGTYPNYPAFAALGDASATWERRVRSYLDSNCAHCHLPGGEGVKFDGRYSTPLLSQNIIAPGAFFNGLVRYNANAASRLYFRDAAIINPMPPLARNVPDQAILSAYSAWVNYPYDIASVTTLTATQVRVKFTDPVDPVSAAVAANYAIDGGVTVFAATPDVDPTEVVLTTSTLAPDTSYTVTINRVAELAAPQNPIWPNTKVTFWSLLTDTDNDTIADIYDWDDDNDGVPDGIDADPLSAGNNAEIKLPLNSAREGAEIITTLQKDNVFNVLRE